MAATIQKDHYYFGIIDYIFDLLRLSVLSI